MDFLTRLFDTSDYPARWHCGRWEDFVGWLHIGSDTLIFAAYFLIPIILYVYYKIANGELPKPVRKLLPCFGIFIFCCGATHLTDAVMFYYPAYRFLGVMKAATAIASWATLVAIGFQSKQLFQLKSGEDFKLMENARDVAREEVKATKQELRTLDSLNTEIQERIKLLDEQLTAFRKDIEENYDAS